MRKTLDKLWWELDRYTWRSRSWIRYPRSNYYRRRKWKSRPVEGDWIEDCRGQVHQVAKADGDDLILDDGYSVSWMHCCTHATGEHDEQQRSGDTSQP